MNFRSELAEKVMRGEKLTTRRLTSRNPASPWWYGGCHLIRGRTYAVCPGRGKHAIGRVRIVQMKLVRLGVLSDVEAQREGFEDSRSFRAAWREINGRYDTQELVWRIDFEVADA